MAIKHIIVLFVETPRKFITAVNSWEICCRSKQLGNLLSLCREIAGARDILQKFENLKKQHE
jgi:hypothetical protein